MSVEVVTDELVTAAQSGDPAALTAVYRGLAPAVLGYLRSKGIADAEAATSDVFLAVFGQLRGLHGGAAGLRKLVFSIAHARMVDEHRARKRRPATISWAAETDPRQAPSAEHEAEQNASTARVMALLDRLPPDQREVLVLRIVADLTVDQVAEIMGRSSGAIKQLQRRGMLTVRAIVSERGVTL
jgi:RNA polymerase sigma-70 factor (ECF subfamily)